MKKLVMRWVVVTSLSLFFVTSTAFAKGPGKGGTGDGPAGSDKGEKKSRYADDRGHRTEKEGEWGPPGQRKGNQAEGHIQEPEGNFGQGSERAEKKMKGAVQEQEQREIKGLEKQREKKAEQVQKELNKGSETGQEARQNRKKWWKFWGE